MIQENSPSSCWTCWHRRHRLRHPASPSRCRARHRAAVRRAPWSRFRRRHPLASCEAIDVQTLKPRDAMLLLGTGHLFPGPCPGVCPEFARFSADGEGHPQKLRGSSLRPSGTWSPRAWGRPVVPQLSVARGQDPHVTYRPFQVPGAHPPGGAGLAPQFDGRSRRQDLDGWRTGGVARRQDPRADPHAALWLRRFRGRARLQHRQRPGHLPPAASNTERLFNSAKILRMPIRSRSSR